MKRVESKNEQFWRKLFYTPPTTWAGLKEHCSRNCVMERPDIKEDLCQRCSAMEGWLGRDHSLFRVIEGISEIKEKLKEYATRKSK